jgi:hypothetical protein
MMYPAHQDQYSILTLCIYSMHKTPRRDWRHFILVQNMIDGLCLRQHKKQIFSPALFFYDNIDGNSIINIFLYINTLQCQKDYLRGLSDDTTESV